MKNKKKLTIDASIAHAAGDTSTFPTSINCRMMLEASEIHILLMCKSMKREWDEHASRFSRTWLVHMTQRNRVIFVDTEELTKNFLAFIDSILDATTKEKSAMKKDAHIASSAAHGDFVVLALDEKVRKYFATYCIEFGSLAKIHWANPDKLDDDAINWIKSGAKKNSALQLKNHIKKEPKSSNKNGVIH